MAQKNQSVVRFSFTFYLSKIFIASSFFLSSRCQTYFLMKSKISITLLIILSICTNLLGQNETRNWAFGSNAGLNFSTNPPTATSYSPLTSIEGISCISDANGNYLFGTNGLVIRDQTNAIMANGNGLFGDQTSSQGVLIARRPNSNIYYVFTVPPSGSNGLYYSIVDMSLAAGMGSVTVKNATLMANFISSEMIAGIKHCNETDIWIVTHPTSPGKFYSFLLTATGLNTTPVISTVGYDTIAFRGYLKFSPDGKKIALPVLTTTLNQQGAVVIHDFDRAAGTVSSASLTLSNIPLPYGIEFSPDGSKIYASHLQPAFPPYSIFQWELCAGNANAINGSKFTLDTEPIQHGALQRAINGKIYVTRSGKDTLGVIHNPNSAGATCSYTRAGQTVSPKTSGWGFPNFVHGYLKPAIAPFTSTSNCQNYKFQANGSSSLCGNLYSPITSVLWDFGDPTTGANNTSIQMNPTHVFSAAGTYTVKVLLTRQCSVDTLIQTISVLGIAPTFSINSKSGICTGQSATLTASGPYSYQWSNGSNSNSISVSPTVTTIYTATASNGLGCTTTQTVQLNVSKCLGVTTSDIKLNISLYPNPNGTGRCVISSDEVISNVQIFDARGRLLLEKNAEKISEFEFSELETGLYYVRLSNGINVYRAKLIVE